MKLALWTLGLSKEPWLRDATEEYAQRIPHLQAFEYEELDTKRLRRITRPEEVRKAEAELVLQKLGGQAVLYLFDERGKRYTSRAFAAFVEQTQHQVGKTVVFLIGGAFGFDESLKTRARGSVRLSDMTLSHQLIRVVALEQLYRAYTILRGLPYHND